MKKITSLLLAMLLVLSIVCLAACDSAKPAGSDTESESAAPTDTDEIQTGTETGTETESETESETETTPAPVVDGLALDTVSEEFDSSMIGGKFTTKSYKFIKSNLFKSSSNGLRYNWYEFYNACVTGVLDLSDEECLSYAEECLAFFNENGLTDEAAQANALIGAAK